MITSKQNPRLKFLLSLRKRREREATGLTLVDGYEELVCALDAGVQVHSLYFCPELMGDTDQAARLRELQRAGIETTELSRPLFEKLAYRDGPDGWLAIVPVPGLALSQITLSSNPLLLICEAVEKPGNLGAMLRSADAAGVDAVIGISNVTDWGNPNVIRASKGAVFSVQVASGDKAQVLDWAQEHRIALVASTPEASQLYTAIDLTKSAALTVGSEKYGHSQQWLDTAQTTARIPMAGKVNSLNVATSAALLLYEAVRQRGI